MRATGASRSGTLADMPHSAYAPDELHQILGLGGREFDAVRLGATGS